ncbi:serine/threonine-protein phosphatase 4 catalytic subunit [Pancytospora philotis]|nr:serine/threonine-protein phosphatase 4 catalytic subunit [Pancytospora philotis]
MDGRRKTIARCIERIVAFDILDAEEVAYICSCVMDIMVLEPNICYVSSPVVVVGDIHGQFTDLLTMLQLEGPPGRAAYVFLGDYVDRGENSLGVILLLMAYKVLRPDRIVLVRGNHEQSSINRSYGFYDECVGKYGDATVWRLVNEVFSYFAIACVVDGRYLCIHGGISPRVSVNKLERIDRFDAVQDDSIFTDVLWSDPFYKPGASLNPRGSGFLFGEDVIKRFLMYNNLEMVIRSHQLAIEGYKWDFGALCLTVWSAPDYMGKCSNPGSILVIRAGQPITANSLRLYKKTKKADLAAVDAGLYIVDE